MTFPDQPSPNAAEYFAAYREQIAAAWESVDPGKVDEAARTLLGAFDSGNRVYACGNGGSAAIANHLLCDFEKGIQTDTNVIPRVVSLSANIEIITAISNDIAYEEIFAYQLRTLAVPGDILITISSSGDSENVVRAQAWARENGVKAIALTGFDGGRTAEGADINIHVGADNYGVVEDVHQSVMHVLAQSMRLARMDPALIPQRKF